MPVPGARKSPSWGLSLSGGGVDTGRLLGGVESPPSTLLINWADYCAKPYAKLCAETDTDLYLCPLGAGPPIPLGQLVSPPHLGQPQGEAE